MSNLGLCLTDKNIVTKKLWGAYSNFGQCLRVNLVLAEKKPSFMFHWKTP